MRLGNFGVLIPQGTEFGDGKVALGHGTVYRVRLQNLSHSLRADADVVIDGKPVGTFRLAAGEKLDLERPADDTGCLTFYKAGSPEAEKAELGTVSKSDLGLVSVTFRPEKPKPPVHHVVPTGSWIPHKPYPPPYTLNADSPESAVLRSFGGVGGSSAQPRTVHPQGLSFGAGGTGLSGESRQKFVTVAPLDYDPDREVVIHLRLVEAKGVRPLKAARRLETAVPDPIC